MRRRAAVLVVLVLAAVLAAGRAEAAAMATSPQRSPAVAAMPVTGLAAAAQAGTALADFDGDGTLDLAVGVPGEDVGRVADAGAVQVLYGAAGGPPAGGVTLLTQSNPEAGDRLGAALAAGDFDGDGFGDLAAGAPSEDVSGAADAGVVNVFSGGPGGLGGGGRTLVQGNPEAGDRFGTALAAAVFDERDRLADLAVGVPGEDAASPDLPGRPVVTLPDTGTVSVYYGAGGGLAGGGQALLPIGRQRSDGLGSSLAPAFLDDSEPFTAYLIAGAPGADLGPVTDVGKIEIFVTRDQQLTFTSFSHYQGRDGVPGSPEAGDRFGAAVAAGPVRGLTGGFPLDDVAVGAPGEDVGSLADAGSVTILVDADPHFGTLSARVLLQGHAGLSGAAEAGDRFGTALAFGPLNAGAAYDLAAGASGEDVGADPDAGAVTVLFGTAGGLTTAGTRLILQANPEAGDRLGAALAAGDLDGDGVAELAAGAPGENVGSAADAGGVELVTGPGSRLLHQDMLGSRAEPGDAFGSALATG